MNTSLRSRKGSSSCSGASGQLKRQWWWRHENMKVAEKHDWLQSNIKTPRTPIHLNNFYLLRFTNKVTNLFIYCSAKRKVLFLIRSLNTLYLVQNIPLKAVDDSLHVFFFCYAFFHSSIVFWKSNHFCTMSTTTQKKGNHWVKLGAVRDSKTARKTSEK